MSVSSFDPNAAAVTMTDTALRHFERAVASAKNEVVRLSTKESGYTGCLCRSG